jgi:putative methylase
MAKVNAPNKSTYNKKKASYRLSKSGLAIFLSRLEGFLEPDLYSEQYSTDSETSASVLWDLYISGFIEDKVVCDMGAGTGILGIGALFLGAKECYFVEKDEKAIKILKSNLKMSKGGRAIVIDGDVSNLCEKDFKNKIDLILQNPPFGTKKRNADKGFLEKSFSLCDKVASFHKSSTERFINAISNDYNFSIWKRWDFSYPLKKSFLFHKSRINYIDVSCFFFVKN